MSKSNSNKRLFIRNLLWGSEADARGRWLVKAGDFAQSVRDYEKLAIIGSALSEMPGRFSMAGELCLSLAGNHAPSSRVQAELALRQLADQPSPIRARASLALGTNALGRENPDKAIQFYQKAQSGNTLGDFLALLMTAAALDISGDKAKARQILAGIEPLAYVIRKFYPSYFYNYLNSCAMVETNRDIALKQASIAASSPYSSRFPEWQATQRELQETSPMGFVVVPEIVIPSKADSMCRIERVVYDRRRTATELARCADFVEKAVAI